MVMISVFWLCPFSCLFSVVGLFVSFLKGRTDVNCLKVTFNVSFLTVEVVEILVLFYVIYSYSLHCRVLS